MPVFVLTETLTVLANELLGIDPFLKVVSAVAILFMSLALVGLATGLGARYPRFNAESPTDVAGSYGGVMFMIVAVLFVIVACVLVGLALVAVSLASRAGRAAVRPPAVDGVALLSRPESRSAF